MKQFLMIFYLHTKQFTSQKHDKVQSIPTKKAHKG